MTVIALSILETVVAGLATYVMGKVVCRSLPFIGRMEPISVGGGSIEVAVKEAAEEKKDASHAVAGNDDMMTAILLILASVLIGAHLNAWVRSVHFVLPGFLTAMIGGLIIVNAVMAIARYVLLPALGHTFDAAVASGGFLGFGLRSMPVATASMEKMTWCFGPVRQSFLIITLAGNSLVDPANATVLKLFHVIPIGH